MSLAFDTGLAGHSHGVGYSGFGGYGNFGYYGGVPMMHRPTTLDLPPFPRTESRVGALPTTPAPMPPLPGTGSTPTLPKALELPGTPAIPLPGDSKKDKPRVQRQAPGHRGSMRAGRRGGER